MLSSEMEGRVSTILVNLSSIKKTVLPSEQKAGVLIGHYKVSNLLSSGLLLSKAVHLAFLHCLMETGA